MSKVTISQERYNSLRRAEAQLNELEIRGVDNWQGYVGSYFYCRHCDNESEWFDVEDYVCPHCNEENDLW